jgi:hypothetical protein
MDQIKLMELEHELSTRDKAKSEFRVTLTSLKDGHGAPEGEGPTMDVIFLVERRDRDLPGVVEEESVQGDMINYCKRLQAAGHIDVEVANSHLGDLKSAWPRGVVRVALNQYAQTFAQTP